LPEVTIDTSITPKGQAFDNFPLFGATAYQQQRAERQVFRLLHSFTIPAQTKIIAALSTIPPPSTATTRAAGDVLNHGVILEIM